MSFQGTLHILNIRGFRAPKTIAVFGATTMEPICRMLRQITSLTVTWKFWDYLILYLYDGRLFGERPDWLLPFVCEYKLT